MIMDAWYIKRLLTIATRGSPVMLTVARHDFTIIAIDLNWRV
jgi:hypothetical protein